MMTLAEEIAIVCDVYTEKAERLSKVSKGDDFWTGYDTGQVRMAEHIREILERHKQ